MASLKWCAGAAGETPGAARRLAQREAVHPALQDDRLGRRHELILQVAVVIGPPLCRFCRLAHLDTVQIDA
ncbi:MAG: hypothetical protein WDN08_17820 [Rhizomicrobium sp.]